MDNKFDLRDLLRSWPYDPDEDVRIITCADGREVLQVRLPMGIEQYELKGRPDGERPHGKESALEYYLERFAEAERDGTVSEFHLDSDECAELFTEGTLYYYRYLHLFQAKDWAGTIRDTARNLQLFDFVHRCAEDEEDQMYMEQWRPYLLRMNAAAEVMLKLEHNQYGPAMDVVNAAIAKIQSLDDMDDETFQFERERSLTALKEMASQIEETQPLSQIESLERELRKAIETQHFEHAADLRDRIRALRSQPKQ